MTALPARVDERVSNAPPQLTPFQKGEPRQVDLGRAGGLASAARRAEYTRPLRDFLSGNLRYAVEGLCGLARGYEERIAADKRGGSNADKQRLADLYTRIGKLCAGVVPVSVHHAGASGEALPSIPAAALGLLVARAAEMQAAGRLTAEGVPIGDLASAAAAPAAGDTTMVSGGCDAPGVDAAAPAVAPEPAVDSQAGEGIPSGVQGSSGPPAKP